MPKKGAGSSERAEGEPKRSEDFKKADALRAKALKSLTGFSMKSKTKRQEAALEMLEDAAGKFKYDLAWDEAADCYEKTLELLGEMKVTDEVEIQLRNATYQCAVCYATEEDGEKAHEKFWASAMLQKEANKFIMAAKQYKECAEMEMELKMFDKAEESWAEAADAFATEGSKLHAKECYLKLAGMKLDQNDYPKSIELYEKAVDMQKDSATDRMKSRDFLFTSHLIRFAHAVKEGKDVAEVQSRVGHLCESFHGFKGEHQERLLSATLQAFLDDNVDKYTEALAKYDAQYKLKPYEVKLYLIIKKKMLGEDASKAGVEDDVESLLM